MRAGAVALTAAGLWAALAVAVADAAVVPRETYVRRADAVCLDVARKAVALQQEAQRLVAAADSDAEARRILVRVYRRQLELVRGMRRRLVAIGTPRGASAARVASRLVAGVRAGERALEDVVATAESGSLTAFQRAVGRYRSISLESARAVRRSGLGFRYCGSGA